MSSAVPIEVNPGVSGNNNSNSNSVSPNQNRTIGRRSPLMMPLMEAFRRRSKSDSKSSSTLDISKHRSGSTSGPSYGHGSGGGRSFMNTIRSHIPWSDKRSVSVDTSAANNATASPSPSPHTPSSLTASRESGFHALASHLSPVANLPAHSSSRLDPYYTYTYGQDPRYGSRGAGKSRRSAMDIFKRSDSLHQQQHHQHLHHQSSTGSTGSGGTGSGKRSFDFGDLRENEHLVFVQFFKHYRCYDLIPVSAKLIVLDSQLMVKKAFHALVSNGVRSAPLWDASEQRFTGMLTITDFINILRTYYKTPAIKMEELEEQKLQKWKQLLQTQDQKPIFCTIDPYASLYDAIRTLIQQKVHRLPVIDRETGNVLYIMTHKRILKFLFLYYNELPLPRHLDKPIRELKLGTYENIATATMNTPLIDALHAFNERRVSALPVVDDDGKVIDVYAKFDVINLAAEKTYHNLDITIKKALEYRTAYFEGVVKCTPDETLSQVVEKIVKAEVHRIVIVDANDLVIGMISLSDILSYLVLRPTSMEARKEVINTAIHEHTLLEESEDNLLAEQSREE